MRKNFDKKNLIPCKSFVYWLRLIYSFYKKKTPKPMKGWVLYIFVV